jgi:hypothetical protein
VLDVARHARASHDKPELSQHSLNDRTPLRRASDLSRGRAVRPKNDAISFLRVSDPARLYGLPVRFSDFVNDNLIRVHLHLLALDTNDRSEIPIGLRRTI